MKIHFDTLDKLVITIRQQETTLKEQIKDFNNITKQYETFKFC